MLPIGCKLCPYKYTLGKGGVAGGWGGNPPQKKRKKTEKKKKGAVRIDMKWTSSGDRGSQK
jgi:hypothetical protein